MNIHIDIFNYKATVYSDLKMIFVISLLLDNFIFGVKKFNIVVKCAEKK